jgi:5-(aminomethyl)-3-furanmethanol phosphate kinase
MNFRSPKILRGSSPVRRQLARHTVAAGSGLNKNFVADLASRVVLPSQSETNRRSTGTGDMSAMSTSLIVYKLGGSLLDLPDLAGVLKAVLALRAQSGALIVVGGGKAADIVRSWDQRFALGDVAAHDLALAAMRLNETLVARLLPGTKTVRSARQAIDAARAGAIGLLCAECFLPWAEGRGRPALPRSWSVTSDSIAAWVASALDAAELVLIKSAPLPAGMSLEAATRAGLVDPSFAEHSRPIPSLGWVNARERPLEIVRWHLN